MAHGALDSQLEMHPDSRSPALRKAANNASYSTDWKCLAVGLMIFEAFTLQLTFLLQAKLLIVITCPWEWRL